MGMSPNYIDQEPATSTITETTTDESHTLKIDATEEPTPKTITSLGQLKPGSLFRYAKSGTLYLKARDGSIRNVDKAIKRYLKSQKSNLTLDEAKRNMGLPTQENLINNDNSK